jgi:hypothetical protein
MEAFIRTHPRPWDTLVVPCASRAVDELFAAKTWLPWTQDLMDGEVHVPPPGLPALTQSEIKAAFDRLVRLVPKGPQRKAATANLKTFRLVTFEGLASKEVARRLGVTAARVSQRLSAARALLRRHWRVVFPELDPETR